MQSESYLVNNLIIDQLATHLPDSICHTIFDEFLVEQNYLTELTRTIQEQSLNYLGFEAKVKVHGASITCIEEGLEIETKEYAPSNTNDPEPSIDVCKGVHLEAGWKQESEYEIPSPTNKVRLLEAGKISLEQYVQIPDPEIEVIEPTFGANNQSESILSNPYEWF
jgi:hypothetical protein